MIGREFIVLLHGLDLQSNAAVVADKGHASAKNRGYLQDRSFTDGIMSRAARGRSLTEDEKAHNRSISKIALRPRADFRDPQAEIRPISGALRWHTENTISIAFNLRKAATMLN